jgi:flagellar M-ring protein FliF
VSATLREPMLLEAGTRHVEVFAHGDEQLLPSQDDSGGDALLTRPQNKTYQLQQGIFEQVSEHIRREPAQSTRLIEAWIGTSEEKA